MRLLMSLIVLFPALAWAYRPPTDSGQSDTSIYQECLWNKKTMETEVDCNDLYNHYLPKKFRYRPSGEVRLAKYNIFRSYEQQQKRWDLTAQMINDEWDLIAISELQPNKSQILQANVNAAVALEKGDIKEADFKKAYFDPSYVTLLKELQKLDESWALIISPYAQSNADTELFAFAYRADQVKIQESKYCKAKFIDNKPYEDGEFIFQEIRAEDYLRGSGSSEGVVKTDDGKPINDRDFEYPKEGEAFACILKIEDFGNDGNFNKIPLTAHFVSGDFDFSYISAHLGFRGPFEVNGRHCREECQEHTTSLMEHVLKDITPKAKRDELREAMESKGLGKGDLGRSTSRQMVRFFQVHQIMKAAAEIAEINGDKDMIVSGDFNLEPATRGWQKLMWEQLAAFLGPESQLYVDSETSISNKDGYNKSYDHFLFNPSSEHVGECDPETADRYDFLDESLVTSEGFELGEEIDKYDDKDNLSELNAITTQYFKDRLWVSSQGTTYTYEDLKNIVDKADGTEYRSLQVQVKKACDAQGVEELDKKDWKWMNIVDAQINETYCKFWSNFLPNSRGDMEPFQRFTFTMSDHLPVGMTCKAK